MTTGKTIALTKWTFVDKVISLFFNMLPRVVIARVQPWWIHGIRRVDGVGVERLVY